MRLYIRFLALGAFRNGNGMDHAILVGVELDLPEPDLVESDLMGRIQITIPRRIVLGETTQTSPPSCVGSMIAHHPILFRSIPPVSRNSKDYN